MKNIIAFFNEWYWMGQIIFMVAFGVWSLFITWNYVTPDSWVLHTDFFRNNPEFLYVTSCFWGYFLAPTINEKLFGQKH